MNARIFALAIVLLTGVVMLGTEGQALAQPQPSVESKRVQILSLLISFDRDYAEDYGLITDKRRLMSRVEPADGATPGEQADLTSVRQEASAKLKNADIKIRRGLDDFATKLSGTLREIEPADNPDRRVAAALIVAYSHRLDPEYRAALLVKMGTAEPAVLDRIGEELFAIAVAERAANPWMAGKDLPPGAEPIETRIVRGWTGAIAQQALADEQAAGIVFDALPAERRTLAPSPLVLPPASLPGEVRQAEAAFLIEVLVSIGISPQGQPIRCANRILQAVRWAPSKCPMLENGLMQVRRRLLPTAPDGERDRLRNDCDTVVQFAGVEGDFESFKKWVTQRFEQLGQDLNEVKGRLAALEAWRLVVDARLADLEARVAYLELNSAPWLGPSRLPEPTSADIDGDGIKDNIEQALLGMFAPTFVLDTPRGAVEDKIGTPGSLADRFFSGRIAVPEGTERAPDSAERRMEWLKDGAYAKLSATQQHDYNMDFAEWTLSPSWKDVRSSGVPIFGRVWRPPHPTLPQSIRRQVTLNAGSSKYDVLSVQYFVFLGFNWSPVPKPGCRDGSGDHQGDWICVDFTVEIMNGRPAIVEGIYHNHGRQLFATAKSMTFTQVLADGAPRNSPCVYLEGGTNEPWPFKGGGGQGNLDAESHPGFGWNTNFGFMEDFVVAGHAGLGQPWSTGPGTPTRIHNVGDYFSGNPAPVDDDRDTQVFLRFAGRCGNYSKPVKIIDKKVFDVDCPETPAHQDSMWKRAFKEGRVRPLSGCLYPLDAQ